MSEATPCDESEVVAEAEVKPKENDRNHKWRGKEKDHYAESRARDQPQLVLDCQLFRLVEHPVPLQVRDRRRTLFLFRRVRLMVVRLFLVA